ncbi:MAG: hypothetical protein GY823_07835 [Flavobacteriaceae bacterium]|nr:hypothetical protein [Flavobacteriaceae bacterium]
MKKSSSKSKTKDKKKVKSKNVPEESNMNKLLVLFMIVIVIICLYLIYAYSNKIWPFKKEKDSDSDKDNSSTSPSPNSNYSNFNLLQNRISKSSNDKIPIVKLSSDYRVPIEVFNGHAARSLPTTAEVRKLIHQKYIPDMVGIPDVGKPFRLPLERNIDENLLKEILYASIKDMYEYDDVIFIKTIEPNVVFGVVSRMSGQMINYCDPEIAECTPVEVFFYNGFKNQEQ